jgi:hypothetical protein
MSLMLDALGRLARPLLFQIAAKGAAWAAPRAADRTTGGGAWSKGWAARRPAGSR